VKKTAGGKCFSQDKQKVREEEGEIQEQVDHNEEPAASY
jgi:hypothetical protein